MALDEIKKQVVTMLRSVMSLDSQQRSEAMGFLQSCAQSYGLDIMKIEGEGSPEGTMMSGMAIQEDNVSCTDDVVPDLDVHTDAGTDFVEQSSPTDLSKSTGQKETLKEEGSESLDPGAEEIVAKKTIHKRSRRKEIFTRKSVRWLANDNKTVKDCPTKESNINQRLQKLYGAIPKTDHEPDFANLKCPGCPFVCGNKSDLLFHFKTHAKATMSCRMCKFYFSSVLNFWRHKRNGKCKMSQLVCSECGEKFKYRRHYLKHIVGHKDNNCQYCDEKFSTWSHYKEHLKLNHPNVKTERDLIPCKFCPMSFRRHVGLYNHYRVKHSKGKFVCLSCGLLLPTKEKHREHMQVHESEKNWQCKVCKMKFYRRQQLMFHVSMHELAVYSCVTCAITVTSKTDLAKHRKDGHEVRSLKPRLQCHVCSKTFDKSLGLQNHLATHSKDPKYYCKHCVKSFTTLDALLKHEKRKTHFEKAQVVIPESKYEKIYQDKLICETCGKQYKTQTHLKWHLRVHNSVHKCLHCEKTFSYKVNLTRHMKLHGDRVRVLCELCGDSFNQLFALHEHNKMKHSEAKTEACELCHKAFKRKSELNRHMRTHDSKRPFVCHCGQSYKQSAHLRVHQKSVHGKELLAAPADNPAPFPPPEPEVYSPELVYRPERRVQKQTFVTGEHGTLLSLGNLDGEPDYAIQDPAMHDTLPRIPDDGLQLPGGPVPYVPSDYVPNGMDPLNVAYDDLNFGTLWI